MTHVMVLHRPLGADEARRVLTELRKIDVGLALVRGWTSPDYQPAFVNLDEPQVSAEMRASVQEAVERALPEIAAERWREIERRTGQRMR